MDGNQNIEMNLWNWTIRRRARTNATKSTQRQTSKVEAPFVVLQNSHDGNCDPKIITTTHDPIRNRTNFTAFTKTTITSVVTSVQQHYLRIFGSTKSFKTILFFFIVFVYILITATTSEGIGHVELEKTSHFLEAQLDLDNNDLTGINNDRLVTSERILPHVVSNHNWNDSMVHHHHQSTTDEFPFPEFPSVQQVLELYPHVPIIALYFAASWCPMSTPQTQLLDELFRDHLASSSSSSHHKKNQAPMLSLVYVSSDQNIESFNAYIQPGWHSIPYNNYKERANIKRYFRTCAKREMVELGIVQRLHEIPNLIVLSTVSRTVVTDHGLPDLHGISGIQAIQNWQK
jgi:Thioredoxin-like